MPNTCQKVLDELFLSRDSHESDICVMTLDRHVSYFTEEST